MKLNLFNKTKPVQKVSDNQVTLVVTTHALADCIESIAADLKMQDLVELSGQIRIEANRYGDDFSNLSEYLLERIKDLGYNKYQILPVMCFLLHRECKKIEDNFKREKPLSDYIQIDQAKAIKKYSEKDFMSREMIAAVSAILMDVRKNNFNK